MPRQRMLHPSYFTDGELWDALPDWGLLFYTGLWCVAEDSGCLEGHAGTLRAMILGHRPNVTNAHVSKVLDKLVDLGKLDAYQATNGHAAKRYYYLVNFHKHQRIDYPTPPKLPLPDFITWHGEDECAEGVKGEEGYRSNRRKWHYEVH